MSCIKATAIDLEAKLIKRSDQNDDACWDERRRERMKHRNRRNRRNGIPNTPGRMFTEAAIDLAGELTVRYVWPCLRPAAEDCWEATTDGARCAYNACDNCIRQQAQNLADVARAEVSRDEARRASRGGPSVSERTQRDSGHGIQDEDVCYDEEVVTSSNRGDGREPTRDGHQEQSSYTYYSHDTVNSAATRSPARQRMQRDPLRRHH